MNEPLIFDPGAPFPRVSILLYGDSGVGKTTFAATAPDPLFIDVEDGLRSLRVRVPYWPVRSLNDLRRVFQYLSNPQRDPRVPIRTVVIDTLTHLQVLIMDEVVRNFPSKSRPYGDLLSQADYGKVIADLMKVVRTFLSLDLNVIFLARTAGAKGATDRIMPALVGTNTAQNVAALVDAVLYYEIGERGERVLWADTSKALTKNRIGLPNPVVHPTWEKLFPSLNQEG